MFLRTFALVPDSPPCAFRFILQNPPAHAHAGQHMQCGEAGTRANLGALVAAVADVSLAQPIRGASTDTACRQATHASAHACMHVRMHTNALHFAQGVAVRYDWSVGMPPNDWSLV